MGREGAEKGGFRLFCCPQEASWILSPNKPDCNLFDFFDEACALRCQKIIRPTPVQRELLRYNLYFAAPKLSWPKIKWCNVIVWGQMLYFREESVSHSTNHRVFCKIEHPFRVEKPLIFARKMPISAPIHWHSPTNESRKACHHYLEENIHYLVGDLAFFPSSAEILRAEVLNPFMH